ncbi:phnA protein [bacterium]|jgi:protein PhnA|nr:phnA protein [bacterium]MDA7917650.1 phnA protein [bacterium]MDB4382720.1 hypothetical protein [Akkermansiaceae bacterium]MDF1711784.1 hypothetical protein [Akkermansiaceae bacterium]
MGRGYEENQERLGILQSFGRDLARRAKSTCELSGAKGVPLAIYEVPPVPKSPDFERCLLLSEDTIASLSKPSLLNADDWRHLSELIWSEQPLQQVMSYRILEFLAKNHDWCSAILEEAYVDDEVIAEARAVPII